MDQNEKDKQKLAIYNQDINKFKGKIQKKNQNNRTEDEWKTTFELYHQDKTAKIGEKTAKIQEISARKTHQIQQRNELSEMVKTIGKKHAFKKYDQFALNTSCFWGSTGSNITPIVQFQEIIVTKIMNKLIYYYC